MTRYAVYRQVSGSWLQTSCTASDWSNPQDTKQLLCSVSMGTSHWCLPTWDLLGGNIFRPTGPVSNPIWVLHQDVHVALLVHDLLFWLWTHTNTQFSLDLHRHHSKDKKPRDLQRKRRREESYVGEWQPSLKQNPSSYRTHETHIHIQVQNFRARGCHGNRPTSYLAVCPAGNIHVKDDLSVILGAMGPWRTVDRETDETCQGHRI